MKISFALLASLLIGLSLSACDEFPVLPPDDGDDKDTIEALRTPDDRFEGLVDYPFEPKYVTVMPGRLRMHYIDEGPTDGPLVLLLHGNPSWTYGLRKMIPLLVEQGYRVVAPDLIGFGKSDKPVAREAHTYDHQEQWVTSFIRQLGLQDINMHVQDWGGLIGLRIAIKHQERFATVAASNTALPTGIAETEAFRIWRDSISQVIPSYGVLIQSVTFTELTPAEQAAYDAPFPSEAYKAGPRQLPQSVPSDSLDPDAIENQRLLERWTQWQKPLLVIFSEEDDITTGFDQLLINTVPGAAGQPHVNLPETGHYIREDAPVEMAERLDDFIKSVQ